MDGPIITSQALEQTSCEADTEHTRDLVSDRDLFSYVLSNINNVGKMASGKPVDIAVSMTSKILDTGKLVGKASDSKVAVAGITAGQIIVHTAALVTVASKGPTGALIAIGATLAKKTALGLSLAGVCSAWPDEGKNYSAVHHTNQIIDFIRNLGIGPVHVVAQSYGGQIALRAALQAPELFRSLVLQEPASNTIFANRA